MDKKDLNLTNEDWAYIYCGNSTFDKGIRHMYIREQADNGKHIDSNNINDPIFQKILKTINEIGPDETFKKVILHQDDKLWKFVYGTI